jgi:hypothetical protein
MNERKKKENRISQLPFLLYTWRSNFSACEATFSHCPCQNNSKVETTKSFLVLEVKAKSLISLLYRSHFLPDQSFTLT